MIREFEHYIREKAARKTIPNTAMAKSLLQKAETRMKRVSGESIEEENSSLIFEDIYESLREAAQSLMELKGYKPYSHEVVVSFLKEYKLLSEENTHVLDTYRTLRNNSVYRAEMVSVEKCKEAFSFAHRILPEIRQTFERMNEYKG